MVFLPLLDPTLQLRLFIPADDLSTVPPHPSPPSKVTAFPQGFGMIGMSGYRAEAAAAAAAHVAQQSRRNKLRVQTGGEQAMQVRDVYDPAMFSSTGVMGFGNPGGEFQYQEAMDGSLIGGQGMQFSTGYCENGLQEVVSSSSAGGNQGMGMAGWDGGNELLLLPSYGNQGSNNPRIGGGASVWMGRGHQQWGGDGEFSVTQGGLSLSLASNPAPEMQVQQLEGLQGGSHEVGVLGSYAKIVGSNRGYSHCEGLHGGVIGSSVDVRRAVGPLGPFTGYATILKSSKFLKPAQQLLVEFCNAVTGPNAGREGTVAEKEGGASLSSFYGSVDTGGDAGNGNGPNGTGTVHRPEFQQKKAKLLVMQEEVCRRYKQYHQQMQMVVSSFESVSGLSTATPYTSLALKTVSKHFRCIKNAISDQIRHMSKMLGEELMSSPSSSRGDNNIATPRSKLINQSLRKSGDQTLSGFTDHNPPVWRPQRGLPERSVAVLRAWLFEHFLHPYPTDTDKHMLATQTGLSRNQVSNWFINARVRLWKPMVEEIHVLETKGMAEMNLNSGNKNDGKMAVNNEHGSGVQSSKHSSDCSSMVSPANDESYRSLEQWHREKRSRMENCIVPGNIDGGLMSFYRGGMEMAGLGAVSLTLGLRHSDGAAGAVHQPPPQQQQMTRHFGNQLVHDFVA